MARYKILYVDEITKTRWCFMAPSNLWECIRTAWMMWNYPDRIGIMVGVPTNFAAKNFQPAEDHIGDEMDSGPMVSPGVSGVLSPNGIPL